MKVTSSVGDEHGLENLVKIADQSVLRAIGAVNEAILGVQAGDPEAAKDIAKHMADLNKALNTSFDERKRLDEHKRKSGELGGGEIDFDAAKSEILDRLARLRATRDTA